MSAGDDQPRITKLDYPQSSEQTPLLHPDGDETRPPSPATPVTGPFWEQVAEGLHQRDRNDLKRETLRYVSFAWAIVCTYVTQTDLHRSILLMRRQSLLRLAYSVFSVRTAFSNTASLFASANQRRLHCRRACSIPPSPALWPDC